jgi:DNA replication licensing factor MCM4
VVKLQETPDAIPEGETPQTVTLNVYQELLDVARPGDRVIVTGIFRANPVRHNSVHRSVRSVFRTYIDAMHFEKEAKRSSDEDDAFITIFEGGGRKEGRRFVASRTGGSLQGRGGKKKGEICLFFFFFF